MNIGCHVSIAGGVWNAPKNAADLGCECFQMFTRSPQGGKAPDLTPEVIEKFKLEMKNYPPRLAETIARRREAGNLQTVYIHTPYYINFASGNNRIRYGSVSVVRDELERGSLLGAKYVMTHLGTAKDLGEEAATQKTIEMLTECLKDYTGSTKLLIENSAGAGAIIGDDLKEIKTIIDGVKSDAIAGICLDTQHSFASGYDWRTRQSFKETLERIDSELGLDLIKLIHANDSQAELASRRDRHEHLGFGLIGTQGFQEFVTFAQEKNIDMILETEHEKVKEDIALLKGMRDK